VKRIRQLNEPTPGLIEYLNDASEAAKWDGLRDHKQGTSYSELVEKLIDTQHGLCGYCEIALTKLDRQIEHVIPRNDPQQGAAGEIEVTNMIACCKGGTNPVFASPNRNRDDERYLEPVKDNMSCGQAKGGRNDADFLDPRKLPARPSLTKVLMDGRIEVDVEACNMAGISSTYVTRTIEILNLNARRLCLAREAWRDDLIERSGQVADPNDPSKMNAWVRSMLTPDENGRLEPFFTTARSYFGPLGERVLAQPPQAWI